MNLARSWDQMNIANRLEEVDVHQGRLQKQKKSFNSFWGRRGGPGKTTLSLFKDVTIRLGWAGVKGKSDNVTLHEVFF